jgi:hypothetical protein
LPFFFWFNRMTDSDYPFRIFKLLKVKMLTYSDCMAKSADFKGTKNIYVYVQ